MADEDTQGAEDAAHVTVAAVQDITVAADALQQAEAEESQEGAIWEPADLDILCGRGAAVNSHQGNKQFRALCFARKPEFDASNPVAKRRISNEIVKATLANGSRFLKRGKQDKGPWFEMPYEKALHKAAQVMRDHRRPDRIAVRDDPNKKARINRATATPMDEVPPAPTEPLAPIVDLPPGVEQNDVLCGRGAFINLHPGTYILWPNNCKAYHTPGDLSHPPSSLFDPPCFR